MDHLGGEAHIHRKFQQCKPEDAKITKCVFTYKPA